MLEGWTIGEVVEVELHPKGFRPQNSAAISGLSAVVGGYLKMRQKMPFGHVELGGFGRCYVVSLIHLDSLLKPDLDKSDFSRFCVADHTPISQADGPGLFSKWLFPHCILAATNADSYVLDRKVVIVSKGWKVVSYGASKDEEQAVVNRIHAVLGDINIVIKPDPGDLHPDQFHTIGGGI